MAEDYTDYPSDFSTLPYIGITPEFVMPYVAVSTCTESEEPLEIGEPTSLLRSLVRKQMYVGMITNVEINLGCHADNNEYHLFPVSTI
jgi:hypothetical protein